MARLDKLLTSGVKVYVASAGAGAGIQKYLWEVPGASRFLVGASFPYAHEEMERFLGYKPEKAVCLSTAVDMAIRSYLFAVRGGDPALTPIGLGLTASVATTQVHRGRHAICCAAVTRSGVFYSEVSLEKGSGRAFRHTDGGFADTVGLEVLLKATNLQSVLLSIPEIPIQEITQEARAAFFARPLFTRDGRRLPAFNAEGRTLFPGAFNPPHAGHFSATDPEVVFQVTANPPRDTYTQEPHKPSLSLTDMLDRYLHLEGKRDTLFLEYADTYLEKARFYPGSAFVVGSDVVPRILDPRWGHEVLPMLDEFLSLGTTFKVALRGQDTFQQVLAQVPEVYRGLFSELPATPYSDLSSRDIRAKNHLTP